MATSVKKLYQFLFSLNPMLTLLEGRITFGSSGAVASIQGNGIQSVTKLDTGRYQITLYKTFAKYLSMQATMQSPLSGSAIDPHTGSVTGTYTITTVGDTDWTTAGVPAGVTPAVGVVFQLAAQPLAGTGRVKANGGSGLMAIEVLGDPNKTLSGTTAPYLVIQTLAPLLTMASYTPAGTITNGTPDTFAGTPAVLTGTVTQTVASPASGSILDFSILLRASPLLGAGE